MENDILFIICFLIIYLILAYKFIKSKCVRVTNNPILPIITLPRQIATFTTTIN